MDETPTSRCVHAPDGYHLHSYRATVAPEGAPPRPAIIELHLHTWMAEHRATFPNSRDVEAYHRLGFDTQPLGKFDTVEEAWTGLKASGEIPPVTCTLPDSSTEKG